MFHLTLNNKLDLTAACYLLSRYILHKKKKEKKKQTTRLVVEQQLTVCLSFLYFFKRTCQQVRACDSIATEIHKCSFDG